MIDSPLQVSDRGPVRIITVNRPDKLNALTFEAYADLRELLAEYRR